MPKTDIDLQEIASLRMAQSRGPGSAGTLTPRRRVF